jgi:hypothetical protein
MPYFAHLKGTEPTLGTVHDDRATAHAAANGQAGYVVTFVCSDEERETWTARESSRFTDGTYTPVPWSSYYHESTDLHYAHLSIKTPGLIAYTPTDEHGIADRQVTVKPGKYLTEFYSDIYSKERIDAFVEKVKATFDDALIATSADDIRQVYVNGPSSCMSHDDDYYWSHVHPVTVYGDSDVACAYLGELRKVSARCLIYPEKKVYTRVYGDKTLERILQRMGYSSGTLNGAHIRCIPVDGGRRRESYVMPYVDWCESADLVRVNGVNWFRLREDDRGEYYTQDTDGVTGETEHYTCRHCDGRMTEDTTYCDSCREDMMSCERCDHESFDSNDFTEVQVRHGHDYYCNDCAEQYSHTCAVCDETWYSRTWEEPVCRSCYDSYTLCIDCDDWTENCDVQRADDDDEARCQDCHDTHVASLSEDIDTPIVATHDTDTLPLPIAEDTTADTTIRRPIDETPFTPVTEVNS